VETGNTARRVAPIPNLAISNALRLTLVGWSKTLSREVGRDGVTCNIVLPGRIATPRITFLDERKAEREGRSVEDIIAESTASIPVGRYGDPAEYGVVVAFLAIAENSGVDGSIVVGRILDNESGNLSIYLSGRPPRFLRSNRTVDPRQPHEPI
jgi:3-oxoacyl-[acyl-carrier protein] reductase